VARREPLGQPPRLGGAAENENPGRNRHGVF
jgi:hypothetical protein